MLRLPPKILLILMRISVFEMNWWQKQVIFLWLKTRSIQTKNWICFSRANGDLCPAPLLTVCVRARPLACTGIVICLVARSAFADPVQDV